MRLLSYVAEIVLLTAVAFSPTCLSAATRLPSFPAKPAGIDQATWTALQNVVAATLPNPASTELTASDGAMADRFGISVALSGTTALVGAYYKTIGSNGFQGAAYVFKFNGSTWVQQQELTASDGAGDDYFGNSVVLSGTTALIAAYGKKIGGNSTQGAAYVFTFNGSTWVQQQELTASDGAAGDYFGQSVALSGTTALIGAPYHSIGSETGEGTAYVFTSDASIWVQQKELTASDGAAYDSFGAAVALSGTTALVGAPNHNGAQGAAYVFQDSGGTWSQQQELTASNGAGGDHFGTTIALSSSTALFGAPSKTIGSNSVQGAVYVFQDSGGTWSQQQELTASNGVQGDSFGASVALSGTTALVGAYYKKIGSNPGQGAAYVFQDSGGTWSQQQELTANDGAATDYFGWSVALSGTTALVGAPFHTFGSNTYQGAAYVFDPVSDTIFCDGFDGIGLCK